MWIYDHGNINHFKLYELIKAQQPRNTQQPVLEINNFFFVHNRQPFTLHHNHEHQKKHHTHINLHHTRWLFSQSTIAIFLYTRKKRSLFAFSLFCSFDAKKTKKKIICALKKCCRHKNVQLEWEGKGKSEMAERKQRW